MICTVSTIKDSASDVARFVERNLAAGADHVFVFAEGGDRDVVALLDEHPHATVVDSDKVHQGNPQPDNLNTRQTINANRINYLLAGLDSVEWLFHIDGDEVLDIDRDRLLALEPETRSVRLMPRESVSSSDPGHAHYFKRLLEPEELSLLTILGVIAEPSNRSYFHAHVTGKVGIRPSVKHGLHIHQARVLGEDDTAVNYRADWLNLLHYDSLTPDECLRNWSDPVTSAPSSHLRGDRTLIHKAMKYLLDNEHLDESERRRYVLEVYGRWIEDDVPALLELGLLKTAEHRNHRPGGFTRRERKTISGLLPKLIKARTDYFLPRKTDLDPAILMQQVGHRGLWRGNRRWS